MLSAYEHHAHMLGNHLVDGECGSPTFQTVLRLHLQTQNSEFSAILQLNGSQTGEFSAVLQFNERVL